MYRWSKFSEGGRLYQYGEVIPSWLHRFDTNVSDLFCWENRGIFPFCKTQCIDLRDKNKI